MKVDTKKSTFIFVILEEKGGINAVCGRWNSSRPLEIMVSDMTVIKTKKKNWEWTILLDTFNNEILAHRVTDIPGCNKPYYDCLAVLNQLAGKAPSGFAR